MLEWLKDEQNLVKSTPLTPTNLMSIISELIYSLLLIEILYLQYVYCQTFYTPRVALCYHPTLKVYTSSVCSSLYQMQIIKLYTGEQVGGAAGMRSEQPDNRKKSGQIAAQNFFLGNCKFYNLFMRTDDTAHVPGNKSRRLQTSLEADYSRPSKILLVSASVYYVISCNPTHSGKQFFMNFIRRLKRSQQFFSLN